MMRLSLFGILSIAACHSPTGLATRAVEVSMAQEVINGEPRSVITVTNNRNEPILIGGCAVWIESRQQTNWQVAYSPSCVGGLYAVAPGASQIRKYPVMTSATYRPVVAYRRTEAGEDVFVYGRHVDW
jgi:hypothetical protein